MWSRFIRSSNRRDFLLKRWQCFQPFLYFQKVIPSDGTVGSEDSSSSNNEDLELSLCFCFPAAPGRTDSGSAAVLSSRLIARMWIAGVNYQRLKLQQDCAAPSWMWPSVRGDYNGECKLRTRQRLLSERLQHCKSAIVFSWHTCGFTETYECIYIEICCWRNSPYGQDLRGAASFLTIFSTAVSGRFR